MHILVKIQGISSPGKLLTAFLGLVFYEALLMVLPSNDLGVLTSALGGMVPEMHLGPNPGQPFASLGMMGPLGSHYLSLQVRDYLTLVLASVTFILGFGLLAQRRPGLRRLSGGLIVLTLVYAAAELVENTLLILMIQAWPKEQLSSLAGIQQIASTVKLTAAVIVVPSFVVSTAAALWPQRRKHQ